MKLDNMRTVTIVITAHQEGQLIYRALDSAERNDRMASKQVQSELLLTLDRPNEESLQIGQIISNSGRARVSIKDFGDLSLSRNAAIRESNSDLVLFLDADDVWSDDFLKEGIASLDSTGSKIAIPEELRLIGENIFGSFLLRRKMKLYSHSKRFRKLLTRNWLPATFLAYRSVFVDFPFFPNDYQRKWGFEDWNFHLRISIAEIPICTVRDTYLEIYQRPGSYGRVSRNRGLDMNPRLRP